MDSIKNDRYYLEKIKTLVCTGDLMNGVLWYTYHRSDATEHLGDSVSRQDAKNCGGSFLSTHRIPNHHIWQLRTTTAFRKTAFRIWNFLRWYEIRMVRCKAPEAFSSWARPRERPSNRMLSSLRKGQAITDEDSRDIGRPHKKRLRAYPWRREQP